MKFPTPISTNHPHWARLCDAQDSLEPSCPLSLLYSTLHILSPKSVDPNIVSLTLETPPANTVMSFLSASSPAYLYLSMVDIPHACGHGLCSPRLSISVRSRCRIPVPICRGSAYVHRPSILDTGTSSPTPCGMSNSSPYVILSCNLSCRKINTFIQTKVAAIIAGF